MRYKAWIKNRQKPQTGVIVILALLAAAALGLWLFNQPGESTKPDGSWHNSSKDPLANNADSPANPWPQSGMLVESAIDAFEDWMKWYLDAAPEERDKLMEEGINLAQRRRSELKALIQEDPEAALAAAIPYELRQELPAAILEHLETPVSDYASFDLLVACFAPDHSEESYERLATIGELGYKVFTYGRRLNVTTKERLSTHGMAIDEDLAMDADPIRILSEAERLDRDFTSPRVIAVGNGYFEWADAAALNRLRQLLRQDEVALGPKPGRLHWELHRGEVEGVSLLLAEDTVGFPEEIEFPELQSPHTEGSKTMLFIRARFSDQEADHEPIDLATLKEGQAGCEAFWYENSYGRSSLTTTFTDTITLPNPASHYHERWIVTSANLSDLFEDALPLVKAAGQAKGQDWDAANYDFFTMITATGDEGQGGAGIASVGGRRSYLTGGAAAMRTGVASHEFGHNLGLRHANYWFTDSTSPIGRDSIPGGYVGDEEGDEWIEYGHEYSIMGRARGDSNYNHYKRRHFTVGEKVKLDWLVSGDGDWVSVNQTTTTPIRLYRQDVESDDFGAMLTGVVRAIKIDVDSGDYAATGKRRYWLSYRRLPTDGVAGNWHPYGLQVDWQKETYGRDGSIHLDMTPYSRNQPEWPSANTDVRDKEDAVVVVGRTYSDEVADIHFTPIALGGENPNEWIDVLVNIGTQDGNTDPEIMFFTASSTAVELGEMVNFSVDAEDADGDTLYYFWDFSADTLYFNWNFTDGGQSFRTWRSVGSMVVENLNSDKASWVWGEDDRGRDVFYGVYTVRVTAFDGKGGSDPMEIYVEVGDVSDLVAIKGRIVSGGFPVQGVRVSNGEWGMPYWREGQFWASEQQAWTDSDGNYVLANLNHGRTGLSQKETQLLKAEKAGIRFEPLFANPVHVAEDADFFGKDWVAVGDAPGSGSLQLMVTPYQTEIPIRSQIEFRALAWDALGKRIEANPAWSVSGGGIIGESGLFLPTEAGGPFRVTATQAGFKGHAFIGVTGTHFDYFILDYPAIAVEDRGYDADPDGDRRPNLVEYAMGGAPDVSDTHYELGLQQELVQIVGPSHHANFRYPRRRDAEQRGLGYQLQWSWDLSPDSWRDYNYINSLEISPIDEIFEEVRFRINDSIGPHAPRWFWRLKIYLNE